MNTLGDRLKEERERVGLTQVAMAAVAGVSKSSQIGWEAGRTAPNAEYLVIAMAQGIDVIYVLTGMRLDAGQLDMFKMAAVTTLSVDVSDEVRESLAAKLADAMRAQAADGLTERLMSAWGRCDTERKELVCRVAEGLAGSADSGKNR